MRIAFVGKGGSGKTTLTALFTQYLERNTDKNIWLVDADLNIHISNLLNLNEVNTSIHLSSGDSQMAIKEYLIGNNKRIQSLRHFKKTTPPTSSSGLIKIGEKNNFIFKNFTSNRNNIYLSVVGTYQDDGIGTSCYHNNLSILENILSHSVDNETYIVVDMVAGIDAFAGTLHSQFDLLVLSVEPTTRSVQVFNQYNDLAKEAGVEEQLYVVANKIRSKKDENFISNNIPTSSLIGFIEESEHVRDVDQDIENLSIDKISNNSIKTLRKIEQYLLRNIVCPNTRLDKLFELHRKYVAQGHVKDRFGDLNNQIDTSFKFDNHN